MEKADDKVKQCQSNQAASGDSTENSSAQATGKESFEVGKESLEDLLSTLKNQMASSDWLEKNTSEKWAEENPTLAKEYLDAMNKKS